uniref:Uncharacterized protein n=1 Tax=Anguilla anguilla TaxID=7936 RepID=A0A0E9S453_ANGAN
MESQPLKWLSSVICFNNFFLISSGISFDCALVETLW